MSTAQDDLVTTIMHHPWLDTAAGKWFEGYCPECQRMIAGGYNSPSHAQHLAAAVLAAGYRKPRAITTAEELDALPFETVIRDGDDCVLERWGDLEESGWVTVMVTSFIPRDQITLPATVLYEPEQGS